jgi:amino acid adenylation domain-containing protein
MLIPEFLERQARERPDKIALVKESTRVSFAQLDRLANRLANGLKASGISRGDRVAIYLSNSIECATSIFGILKADAVFVAINRGSKAQKLVSLLKDCQASALITDSRAVAQGIATEVLSLAPSLKFVLSAGNNSSTNANGHGQLLDFTSFLESASTSEPRRENIDMDLACLIYTSGTTGESKGVMCDHGNLAFVTKAITGYLHNSDQDVVMNVLPLAFSYGLYQLMAMVCAGGTLVLEDSFAFPDLVLEKMAMERVTGFPAVPTIYSTLLNLDTSRHDLSSLRYFTNAAAGLPIEHVQQLRKRFPNVDLFLMHGLTEVARTMYLPPDQAEKRPGSSGVPMPGVELWLEDEDGRRVERGEIGELVVRGPNVMRGYWNSPELSAAKFRKGPFPGERVCYSGDLFRQDDEGHFYFISRKDDIIKSRGEKVAPREVENAIYSLRGVREAAVIGVSDGVFGQVIKAFIVAPDTALTETQVISHCKSRLEDFMVPRQVEFRTELPKTPSGKIRRVDLR